MLSLFPLQYFSASLVASNIYSKNTLPSSVQVSHFYAQIITSEYGLL